ncbi:hypothetical protein EVAR_52150_1 [Eumeta japonica]|uniref:Uncharacterized protein n=1 Tax=Eumeta variegata TaxID=151549 RepID=A0A4C1YBF6_EUMVA|nr:hypothetical protein EVAR_52150_1 [Eumeta japonica]
MVVDNRSGLNVCLGARKRSEHITLVICVTMFPNTSYYLGVRAAARCLCAGVSQIAPKDGDVNETAADHCREPAFRADAPTPPYRGDPRPRRYSIPGPSLGTATKSECKRCQRTFSFLGAHSGPVWVGGCSRRSHQCDEDWASASIVWQRWCRRHRAREGLAE